MVPGLIGMAIDPVMDIDMATGRVVVTGQDRVPGNIVDDTDGVIQRVLEATSRKPIMTSMSSSTTTSTTIPKLTSKSTSRMTIRT